MIPALEHQSAAVRLAVLLQRDAGRQARIARNVLELARELEEVVNSTRSADLQARLRHLQKRAVQTARDLAVNASTGARYAQRRLPD